MMFASWCLNIILRLFGESVKLYYNDKKLSKMHFDYTSLFHGLYLLKDAVLWE